MFTTVNEDKFRQIARLLMEEGKAPAWFANIEYVHWQGKTKNLEFIPNAILEESILVDDFEIYVHPGQAAQWMQIAFFDYPYPEHDGGLFKMLNKLEVRLTSSEQYLISLALFFTLAGMAGITHFSGQFVLEVIKSFVEYRLAF